MNKEDILIEEQSARSQMNTPIFRRLTGYLRPYRRQIIRNLVFAILATASTMAGPWLIRMGIDRYLTNFKSASHAYQGILYISLIYLGNLLLGWYLTVQQVTSAVKTGHAAMGDMQRQVFRHIQSLSMNYFDKTHQGRIINRASVDIEALDQLFTWATIRVTTSILTLTGVIIILAHQNLHLCLAVILVLPPLIIATLLFKKHGFEIQRKMRIQSSRITANLAENISGIRLVQAMNREQTNLDHFVNIHQEYKEQAQQAARIFHTYMPFLGLMSAVGITIILGYGGTLAVHGVITVGTLASFIMYLGMFFGPIQVMGDLNNSMLSAAASAERIFQLLDTQPQIVDRPAALPLPRLTGEVRFENVFFRYDTTPADRWVLKDISFRAEPGMTIALVGATGSGKSSIISLLARFYEPQQGRILLDGMELSTTTTESLHKQLGIVTQENFLFTGTVMDNLKFGRPEACDAEVREAARTLGTDDILSGLKDGYQTKVTERGANFSAGERQLICFTRALVAKPRILILDEATSAVDPQTERILKHALEKLLERQTCFAIAHRLSTIQQAQQILVLSQGEIVERGTHESLLRQNGTYAMLYQEYLPVEGASPYAP
jgi:ATP-binding cassette subfamily B protein